MTKKRMVEVYTSDPTLIYGPRGIGMRNICVLEGKQEKVPILIKSRSHGNQKARVTVVDINTRETLESFLLILESEKPLIEQAHQVKCIAGQTNFYKFKFANPVANEVAEFSLTSSDGRLIQPKSDIVTMQPKQETELCFSLPKQKDVGMYEAVVHLNRQNSAEGYSCSFLFKINVTKN